MRMRNSDGNREIVLIDFGLGALNSSAEDKAVDLYVLERAFASTHPGKEVFLERLMQSYTEHSGKGGQQVLSRLEQVRQRGRKRDMTG